jgi:flagellar protein FliO/FliZ
MKRILNLFILLMLTFIPAFQEAAPENSPPTRETEFSPFFEELKINEKEDPNRFFYEFMSMLTTLGLVIAGVFILSWFVKRMTNTRIQQANASSVIKIVERRSLSPKTTLYLLDVQGKNIAIAESSNGVTYLGNTPAIEEEDVS